MRLHRPREGGIVVITDDLRLVLERKGGGDAATVWPGGGGAPRALEVASPRVEVGRTQAWLVTDQEDAPGSPRAVVGGETGGVVVQGASASLWLWGESFITQSMVHRVFERLGGPPTACLVPQRPASHYACTWPDEDIRNEERYEHLLETLLSTRSSWCILGPWPHPHWKVSGRGGEAQWRRDLQRVAPSIRVDPLGLGAEIDLARGSAQAGAPLDDPAPLPPLATAPFDPQAVEALVAERIAPRMSSLLSRELMGPWRRLWDRRSVLCFEIRGSTQPSLWWHVAGWSNAPLLRRGRHPDPDYTITYSGAALLAAAQSGAPLPVRIRRHLATEAKADGRGDFRLDPLDPARLHGLDPYRLGGQRLDWSPWGDCL